MSLFLGKKGLCAQRQRSFTEISTFNVLVGHFKYPLLIIISKLGFSSIKRKQDKYCRKTNHFAFFYHEIILSTAEFDITLIVLYALLFLKLG